MQKLVNDALEMLRDRSEVADIIYWAVRLSQDERVAIMFAYDILKDEEKQNE